MVLPVPKRAMRSMIALVLVLLIPILIFVRVARNDEDNSRKSMSISGLMEVLKSNRRPAGVPSLSRVSPERKGDQSKGQAWRGRVGTIEQAILNPSPDNDDEDPDQLNYIPQPVAQPPPPDFDTIKHKYEANGMLELNPLSEHPIYDLLATAKANWTARLEHTSKTLDQAATEYRIRYGRAPPAGFDRWFSWAKSHGVELIDEYDQIHRDLEPFWGLKPSELQKLRKEASALEGAYTLSCKREGENKGKCTYNINEEGLNAEGRLVAQQRADASLKLMQEVASLLEDVDVVFYSHDVPTQFVGHDFKLNLIEAASAEEYYDPALYPDKDRTHLGWASACAPHERLRTRYGDHSPPELDGLWQGPRRFVWDHRAAMNPCTHEDLVYLNGFLAGFGKGPTPGDKIFPMLAMCKTQLHSDILSVAEEGWTEDIGEDPKWEEKDERMLWRGKTTGILFHETTPNWNLSQRINLVDRTGRTGADTVPVLKVAARATSVGRPIPRPYDELNPRLVDVGFVDEPIQCDEALCKYLQDNMKFKARKTWTEANNYKYQLDIDGNGWSARFKRLMSSNSAVLKSTVFPEWYTDRIQPWVHYVPLKGDLTDLYDVLTFFHAHDDIGKQIGADGQHWSKQFFRREDMIAYQFRLFLELARLMTSDRKAASFQGGALPASAGSSGDRAAAARRRGRKTK